VLKVLFNVLGDASVKPVDKCIAFCCLEELCSRQSLSQTLAAFTELFIVRVTDVQTAQMPREVSKAAENCGMALAVNFPPEVIARAICPIVNNKDVPVNQVSCLCSVTSNVIVENYLYYKKAANVTSLRN